MTVLEVVNCCNAIKRLVSYSKYKYSCTKNKKYKLIAIEAADLLNSLDITCIDDFGEDIKQKYTDLYLKYKLIGM